ncbi:hypothetical protein HW090_03380 [Pseudomonas sp. ABC1]|uniref:DUF6387 family protein n=1 Tax=Pseudomonas sp. ABC1 TaxID=2748080 RepID=UPI0015C312B4|nr:DUF6387 family protein [Pseudomonas sp. ABC1]QLF92293.1 hypothetical protein HW090_03380 [Pseudomonas sp. ABC1]
MVKINQVDDLPTWYDLEKYGDCESFDGAEWLYQLDRRVDILRMHPDFNEGCNTRDEVERDIVLDVWKESMKEMMESVRQEPMSFQGFNRTDSCFRPSLSVSRVTRRDFKIQACMDEIARRKGEKIPERSDWWRVVRGDKELRPDEDLPANPLFEFDYHMNGHSSIPVLKVDLCATDSVLIASFERWLKEERARRPSHACKREKPSYRDWKRYGLLPYMDLLTWSKENDYQVPHHIMAQAVGYKKGGDSFRKTVPKLASDLIKSLSELEALVALEIDSERFKA